MATQQLQLLEPQTVVNEGRGIENHVLVRSMSQIKRGEIKTPITIPQQSLETALQHIFPTHQEDSRVQRTRRIMGDDVKDLSDEELEVYITKFQYLIDSWFDEYERSVFNNLTLKQLLREA